MSKPVNDEQPVSVSGGTPAYEPWPKAPTQIVLGNDAELRRRIEDLEAALAGLATRLERDIEELRRKANRHQHDPETGLAR